MWKRWSFKSQSASTQSNLREQHNSSGNGENVSGAEIPATEAKAEETKTPINDSTKITSASELVAEKKTTKDLVAPADNESRSQPDVLVVPIGNPAIASISQPNRTVHHRISFRSLAFFYGRDKTVVSGPVSAVSLTSQTAGGLNRKKVKLSRNQKEAREVAIHLRTLMLGPSAETEETDSPGRQKLKSAKTPPVPSLLKVKSQLTKAKSANLIISELRMLPLPDGPSFHATRSASAESLVTHPDINCSPIHAVCLPCTEEDAHKLYFSKLKTGHDLSPYEHLRPVSHAASKPASMATASLESLLSVVQELKVVSLLQSPDLGFGHAISEPGAGPLAGSVPSADTVLEGFEEITKQLTSLGFATGQALPLPSHTGIYPPEDRLSVLTYWWGWELVMPEPTVQHFGNIKSVSGTLLNVLSALSMFNQGVREILPFIRYISNFVDAEWNAIKAQDKGKGVVCAATWLMPAALIPRPWDFLSKPAGTSPSTGISRGESGSSPLGKGPSMKPQQEMPTALDTLMPQLMVTSPTLPRGFNTQQVITV